jgi:signal transduction histidine kinase
MIPLIVGTTLALVALAYVVAGLGTLAAMMAPVLLGPSPAERIETLEAEADQLAERNRLARELHDSIGHALTVTTVQAGAAREVFDSDPQFVWRALGAVEETGRAAMEDLDHVLGLLRADERANAAPSRTLVDLDRLVSDAHAVGTDVMVNVEGSLDEVPAAVAREGYRIVQEGLTNAARHARGVPVSLSIRASHDLLSIEMVNPVSGTQAGPHGGRGLEGIRERVELLGGRMIVEPDDGEWRVAVRLPFGRRWKWRTA